VSEDTIRAILDFVENDTNTPIPDGAGPQTLLGPDGLGLESLSLLELTLSLERRFGIVLPDGEFDGEAVKTVADLVEIVDRHRNDPSVPAASDRRR
jgi:acyl carrier protein